MSNLWFSLSAGLLFLLFACLALGIGRLISGRNRLIKGCGSRPDQESCSLCGKRERCAPPPDESIEPGDTPCDSTPDSQ